MNLEIKNVGKINYANIELNGITVIAGENNTGKSTIGKMLFCVFHSFYRIEEQIKDERVKSIHRLLYDFFHVVYPSIVINPNISAVSEHIVKQKETFLLDKNLLVKELKELAFDNDKVYGQSDKQDELNQLVEKIYTFLKIEDEEIRKIILKKRLEAEFAMRIGHLNLKDDTTVKLNIKSSCIDFIIEKNENINIKNYLNLTKEIIYIDDPFVLDNLDQGILFMIQNQYDHRGDLIHKLTIGRKQSSFTLVDELVVKKKLKKILETMNDVCDGSLSMDEGSHYVYNTDKLNGSLEMVNLSTGMKSFIILRQLLQNGTIDENGIIILDEPEIHLHPEWQLKFAESIVLIQKEFGVNILLNTHSPYFLNAIEVYSKKYGLGSKCNYYLIDEKSGATTVYNVTENTEAIYEKLAQPLQELENLEYRNDTV